MNYQTSSGMGCPRAVAPHIPNNSTNPKNSETDYDGMETESVVLSSANFFLMFSILLLFTPKS